MTAAPGILVCAEELFGPGPGDPRPVADAAVAIERLGWIGLPVIVVGEEIRGRRLPSDPEARLAWVRTQLGCPGMIVVASGEARSGRSEARSGRSPEGANRLSVGRWSELRSEFNAGHLVTGRDADVAPARRAGLTVVRIGPRGSAPGPSIERADHEARDLLDAVSRLITADAFGGSPGA